MDIEAYTIEQLLKDVGVAAVPPEKLTVIVGDTVRVSLSVNYRGPAQVGELWVAIGNKNAWFDEIFVPVAAVPLSFAESVDLVTYTMTCDIPIGDRPGTDYDMYAKIMGVIGDDIFTPTYLNLIDVLPALEFEGFEITSYEKVE